MKEKVESIVGNNPWFILGFLSSSLVLLLYLAAPDDLELRLSTPFASRFIWTPAIPFLVGVSSFSFLYGSITGTFDKIQTFASALLLSIVVVMSFQLSIPSPMGPDGWFFVEASIRFRDFGSLTREYYSYFDHPMTLVICQPFITIWPDKAALICTMFGFIMGVAYFSIILFALYEHDNFERWGVIGALVISALLSIYWNPVQFSAQLLSLVMIYSVFHIFLRTEGNSSLVTTAVIALVLPVTHLFAPIFLITALLAESVLRTKLSMRALAISLICSISFLFWNLTQAEAYFLNQIQPLPDIGKNFLTSLPFTLICCLLIHLVIYLRLRKLGLRDNVVWGEGTGIRNLSILAGCFGLLPVLYIQDAATLAARFTPRLIVYSVVPLIIWSRYPSIRLIEYMDRNYSEDSRKTIIAVLMTALLSSVTVFGHVNLSQRTWILPEDTIDCWDDSEDLGIPVLMTRTRMAMDDIYYEGSTILISPMVISPTLPHYYYKLVDNGDGSISGSTEISEDIVAVIMTSDMPIRIERDGPEIDISNFTIVGASTNACEFWVKNDLLDNLDPEIPWDTEFIIEHESP